MGVTLPTGFCLPGAYTVRNYYNLGVCQYTEVTKQALVQSTQTTTIDFAGTLCHDLVQNGGFEQAEVWRIGSTPWSARYASEQHHTNSWSMRSGIMPAEADRLAESSFYQALTLPADAANITLGFWYLPFTQEASSAPEDWRALSWASYSPEAAIAARSRPPVSPPLTSPPGPPTTGRKSSSSIRTTASWKSCNAVCRMPAPTAGSIAAMTSRPTAGAPLTSISTPTTMASAANAPGCM